MEVSLVMFKSDGMRRDFPIRRNQLIIGRTSAAGLRIPLPSVSRKHCEIAVEGDQVKIRDLGSSNGTTHNGIRVTESTVVAGDQIEVGPVVFTVLIDGQPEDIDPVRSMVATELVDTRTGEPAVKERSDSGSEPISEPLNELDSDQAVEPIAEENDAMAVLAAMAAEPTAVELDDDAASDVELNEPDVIAADAEVEVAIEPEIEAEIEPIIEQVIEAEPEQAANSEVAPDVSAPEPKSESSKDSIAKPSVKAEKSAAIVVPDDSSDDEFDFPIPADTEMDSPTVDFDDPIAALEAMAFADDQMMGDLLENASDSASDQGDAGLDENSSSNSEDATK